ncbi:MAG: hypothetical protein HY966_05530 [Ignavibacteriales bacterium]|nr:hypothetical protein [Ignavibacteriales bacterium]
MRPLTILCLAVLPVAIGLGQGSTRLIGMGGVSLAVPDPQSEFLFNPAKIAQIGGIMIQANPNYMPYSMDYGRSSSYSSGPSTSSSEQTNRTFSLKTLPVVATVSLGFLHFGAMAGTISNSQTYSYTSTSTSTSYSSSSSSKGETSLSQQLLQAVAALDLGFLSVGISARTSSATETSSSSYVSTSSGSSPNTSSSEYETTFGPKSYLAGAVLGSPSSIEVSASYELFSDKSEENTKSSISNGVPATGPFSVYYSSTNNNRATALARFNLGKILLGVRASRLGGTMDYSSKSSYTTPPNTELKTSTQEQTAWDYGAGFSCTVENLGLFSFEYTITSATLNSKSFATYATLGSSGKKFNVGDVVNDGETKTTINSIRGGVEFALSEGFKLRVGPEIMWSGSNYSTNDYLSSSRSEYTGQAYSRIAGYAGATISLAVVRLDYALATNPITIYNYYGPGGDVQFTHYLSATIQL